MTISSSTFWRTTIVGLIATFVMSLTGFWQDAVGLIELDVGAMLAGSFSASHPDVPYTLVGGNLAHFANGVILSLAWVALAHSRIRAGWLVQGLIVTTATTVLAAAIVVPAAAGVGVMFSNTPAPGLMLLSDFVAHAGFGFTLTLGLKLAGVGAADLADAPARPTALRSAA